MKVATTPREPVGATTRRAMTPARRRAVIARDGERCAEPGCIATGTEADHRIALALGGADDAGNLQLLCRDHHKVKTAFDLALIAKAKRLARRESGERRATRPIPSRPFDRSKTRGFDGHVRERTA